MRNIIFIVQLSINSVRLIYSAKVIGLLIHFCMIVLLHEWFVHKAFPLFYLVRNIDLTMYLVELSDVTNTAAILGGSMDDRW